MIVTTGNSPVSRNIEQQQYVSKVRISHSLGREFVLSAQKLLLPLLIATIQCIPLFDDGLIFSRRGRIGRGSRLFGCRKFRTTAVDAEQLLLKWDAHARMEWPRHIQLRSNLGVPLSDRWLAHAQH
jgi:lipopolysaccharide/colanic/teichoic acid biosynthesis glycosyltransferase